MYDLYGQNVLEVATRTPPVDGIKHREVRRDMGADICMYAARFSRCIGVPSSTSDIAVVEMVGKCCVSAAASPSHVGESHTA